MQSLNEPSWQLRTMSNASVNALLYLRDALRLDAPSSAVPPTFTAPVAPAWQPVTAPTSPGTADAEDTTAPTATAWGTWWRDHVAHDLLSDGVDLATSRPAPTWARTHPPRPQPSLIGPGERDYVTADRFAAVSRYLRLLATHVPAPPYYVAVRDPALRRAARQLMLAAQQWAEERQLAAAGLRSGDEADAEAVLPDDGLSVELAHRVAEEVAFDRDVPPEQVRARLMTIEGHTPWWQQWAPGVMVCTRASLVDARAAYSLLQVAFRSHLRVRRRPRGPDPPWRARPSDAGSSSDARGGSGDLGGAAVVG